MGRGAADSVLLRGYRSVDNIDACGIGVTERSVLGTATKNANEDALAASVAQVH